MGNSSGFFYMKHVYSDGVICIFSSLKSQLISSHLMRHSYEVEC